MKMRTHRVVITGLGPLSSIGVGRQAFSTALRQGKSGIYPIKSFDTSGFAYVMGSELQDFQPQAWFRHRAPDTLSRSSHMGVAAAALALEDAGLTRKNMAASPCGVAVGTTDGACCVLEDLTQAWLKAGSLCDLDPQRVAQVPAHRLALSVAQEFQLRGEVETILTACAAGNAALGRAYDLIACGWQDRMLAGGVDAFSRKTFASFYRLGIMAPQVCQPFDSQRKGLITGEGAGLMVLENIEKARGRHARIYAEVLGYAINSDARSIVTPDRQSIARCMHLAHRYAGVRPEDIDYVCAHGTGTLRNDATECAALQDVFGTPPPVSSIKSMIGHTMGAASALGAIACCIGIQESLMPPTLHFKQADPACQVDCIPNVSRSAPLKYVQNNAFAFGGNNAILILSHVDMREGVS